MLHGRTFFNTTGELTTVANRCPLTLAVAQNMHDAEMDLDAVTSSSTCERVKHAKLNAKVKESDWGD